METCKEKLMTKTRNAKLLVVSIVKKGNDGNGAKIHKLKNDSMNNLERTS